MAEAKINNLKQKTIAGILWKFGERFSAQFVSTIVSILLARILMPEEYGVIALVLVFINIANVFVMSGFGSALVQKDKVDDLDYTSIFYVSLFISIALYAIIFFCAPLIATAYGKEIVTPVLRVLALKLPLGSISSVQNSVLARKMQFRKTFFATLAGTIISGVAGVVMAKMGFGIWALVAQYLLSSVIGIIVLAFILKWFPRLRISLKRVIVLLRFGWKLLVSALLDVGYKEVRSLIIGFKYSSEDLAYYNKGNHYPGLVVNNVNNSISAVLLSAMSRKQKDRKKIKEVTRQSIRGFSYIIFPCMIGLAAIAKPFVSVLLTDKWLPIVPYLYIACFTFSFYHVHTSNLTAMQALGKSGLFLTLEIIKKSVGLIILLCSMWFGVFWIALSAILSSVIGMIINIYPNKKLINYGILEQLKDMLPAFLLSIAMGVPVYFMQYLSVYTPIPLWVTLILQVIVGIGIYIGLSILTKNKEFHFILSFGKKRLPSKNNQAVVTENVVENKEIPAKEIENSQNVVTDGSQPSDSNEDSTDVN